MANLTDFFRNTSVPFYGVITQNGVNPDITSDTVRMLIKSKKSDTDANAVYNQLADVATNGASGRFDFNPTPTQTNIANGSYHLEIVWVTAGGEEYVLQQQVITIDERVEDVPA